MKGIAIVDAKSKAQKRGISEISAPVQAAIEKLEKGKLLTGEEKNLLLTPAETAAVLSWKKGSTVSSRYLPQMLRDGRLKPDSLAGGNSYRYKMEQVLEVKFNPRGRPSTSTKPTT